MPQRLRPDALKTFTPKKTPSYLHPWLKWVFALLLASNDWFINTNLRENTKTAEISSHTQWHHESSPEVASASNSEKSIGSETPFSGIYTTSHRSITQHCHTSVLRFAGHTKISETIRFLASKPLLAVKLIQ